MNIISNVAENRYYVDVIPGNLDGVAWFAIGNQNWDEIHEFRYLYMLSYHPYSHIWLENRMRFNVFVN